MNPNDIVLQNSTEIKSVIKRTGEHEPFDREKITAAILSAMDSQNQRDEKAADELTDRAVQKIAEWGLTRPYVDQVHAIVENRLMDARLYDVAREYVIYRFEHMPDMTRKRNNEEPVQYPGALDRVDAINNCFWTHNKWNDLFDADIQDYKVHFTNAERAAAERAMLAISQIENKVKEFWGNLRFHCPHPELGDMGETFSESEVRHKRAYRELLRRLGLEDLFKQIDQIPALNKRVSYLEKANQFANASDPRDYFKTVILFAMFTENVSLFSQFFVLMSFNKHQNQLKGISNVVDATSKEELVHADGGFFLVNTYREENPGWFDESLQAYIKEMADEAFEAECAIIDWIFEEGELDHLAKSTVKEYVKFRLNESLQAIGIDKLYDISQAEMENFMWMEEHNDLSKNIDFFSKRGNEYNKNKETFQTSRLGEKRRQRRQQQTG